MKVDIIIPIYNAYDYLKSCIKSIYEYSDVQTFNLVLINDCSPDKRITEYLSEIIKVYPNIIVLENEINLGFVGTVNKGMRATGNDVILLNSDTEVSPSWIEKIKKAAYSRKEIATVTPLTNSGTICSVPNFCEDNEIPTTFENYLCFAEMIDSIKVAQYSQAPTGVGFCMYIKRTVINEVGYFNEEKFGKGYGEENDFCCRCHEHGYTNIIDDCTFIYHKGSMSFESAKDAYVEANLKVLSSLYPYYNRDVALFCENNPLKPLHECIKLKIKLKEKSNNILFLLHNDFKVGRNHPYGGTEMHVKDIIEHMKYSANCFVMSTSKSNIMLDIYSGDTVATLKLPLEKEIILSDFHRTDYHETVASIIKFFEIGLIHIHHFKGHTFDIIDIAKQMNIPVYYTIHDYFSICPNINLLYDDQIYCRFLQNHATCNKCIKNKHQYNDIISIWREYFYQNLLKIDKIITPSYSTKDILLSYYRSFGYDVDNLDIQVIEHGEFEKRDIKRCNKNKHEGRLSIVIFGGIIKHKGSEMIHRLLSECDKYDWYVFGNIYEDKIKDLKKDNVFIRGAYDKNEILDILLEIHPDLTLTLPIWPETFSYVLSESFSAGIPVLGTNLGALESRIIEGQNGWHVSFPLDISEIKKKLEYIYNHRDLLDEIRDKLLNQPLKFVSMMNEEYEYMYKQDYLPSNNKTTIEENRIILKAFQNKKFEDDCTIDKHMLAEMETLKEQYNVQHEDYLSLLKHVEEVNSSSTWHMLVFMNTHLSGVKKIISSCIHFVKKIFRR